MPIGQIRQVLDLGAINAQMHSPYSGVARGMLRKGLRVQALARRRAPADTGHLRQSIGIATEPRNVEGINTFAIVIGTDLNYAPYIIHGTGVYGPRGTPIRPKTGAYLVFKSRTGKMVFAKSVRGQRPNNFLKDALRGVR